MVLFSQVFGKYPHNASHLGQLPKGENPTPIQEFLFRSSAMHKGEHSDV